MHEIELLPTWRFLVLYFRRVFGGWLFYRDPPSVPHFTLHVPVEFVAYARGYASLLGACGFSVRVVAGELGCYGVAQQRLQMHCFEHMNALRRRAARLGWAGRLLA